MANKFIVFLAFAAVVQASLAATDLKAAEETSRTGWRQAADTICKVVRNQSWPIEDAEEEYQKYQAAGGTPFFEAANLANYPELLNLSSAESTANREAVFNSLAEARECTNYTTTEAAIENYKDSLPYGTFLRAFHAVTNDTGSTTPAVNALKKYYATLFNEVQKLAESVCGGGEAIGPCPTEQLHDEVDVQARILYSWLSEHE